MKSRKLIKSLILVILVVGFVMASFYSTKIMLNEKDVYSFKHDMGVNVLIGEDNIIKDRVTFKDFEPDMVTDPQDILGKYTSTKVFEGHVVRNVFLIEAEDVDPFKDVDFSIYEEVPIPINFITGFGGDFKPGDRINLYFVNDGITKDGMNNEFVYGKKVISNVPVYKILTENGFKFVPRTDFTTANATESEELTGESISTSTNDEDLGVIVVLLTAEQAEEYFAREQAGLIRITGRFDESIDNETNGYVVGDYDEVFTGSVEVETDTGTSTGVVSDGIVDSALMDDYSDYESEDFPSLGEVVEESD